MVKVQNALGCIGTNIDVIRAVAGHANFPDCMRSTMQAIHTVERNNDKPFNVTFVDTGGSHRSVACVEIFGRVCEIDQFSVQKIHMNRSAWRRRKLCQQCDKHSTKSQEFEEIILAVYKRVFNEEA